MTSHTVRCRRATAQSLRGIEPRRASRQPLRVTSSRSGLVQGRNELATSAPVPDFPPIEAGIA